MNNPIVGILIALFVIGLVLFYIRRGKLKEKYAFLWLLVALFSSAAVIFPEPVFKLAVLALKVDITIEDIARPGYQLGFSSGTENGSKAPEQMLLLLRNHGLHPVFDKNFFPVTDGY